MSAAAVAAVLRASIQPATNKLMALVIAWHYNDDKGSAWPSVATMAREGSMSERTIYRRLGELQGMGLLLVASKSKGGNPYASTTRYGLNFQLLSELAGAVRSHGRAASAEGDSAAGGDTAAGGSTAAPQTAGHFDQPPAALAPDPPQHWRKPPATLAPKRDERKPEASLSSKAPAAPDSADGRSADTGNESASGKVVQMSKARQQPALNDGVRLRNLATVVAESPTVWMNDDAALSAVGVRLGLDALAGFVAQGGVRLDYMRAAIAAWGAARDELKAARRKGGATSRAAAAPGSSTR